MVFTPITVIYTGRMILKSIKNNGHGWSSVELKHYIYLSIYIYIHIQALLNHINHYHCKKTS